MLRVERPSWAKIHDLSRGHSVIMPIGGDACARLHTSIKTTSRADQSRAFERMAVSRRNALERRGSRACDSLSEACDVVARVKAGKTRASCPSPVEEAHVRTGGDCDVGLAIPGTRLAARTQAASVIETWEPWGTVAGAGGTWSRWGGSSVARPDREAR
jgi:hypothetical protein